MNKIKEKTEKALDKFITLCTSNHKSNNKSLKYNEEFLDIDNDTNVSPSHNSIKKNTIDYNDHLKMFIHELCIPIYRLSTGIYLLKNSNISDHEKKVLDNMDETITFIEDIFNNFAIIQDSNIKLNIFEPFSIHDLFEKIKHILYYNIKSFEIELDILINIELYDWNYGDKYNIQKCIINILKNAIKYRDLSHKTNITIEVTKKLYKIITPHLPSGPSPSTVAKFKHSYRKSSEQNTHKKQTIIITISDNNQHIIHNIKEHLFETFNTNCGSGLGLYICKTIVELHGGTIVHEFIEPCGNKFIITLTMDLCDDVMLQISTHINGTRVNKKMVSVNVSENVSENVSANKIEIMSERYNVLLVDDDLLTRKLMYTILQNIKIFKNIYTATDGADAIHKIKTYIKSLNVIFLDKQMPIMDGLHCAKGIRDMSYNQLIFGLTGEEDEITQFIESGVDYVITKPLYPSKLGLIENFIEKYGTQRQENKRIKKVNDILEWVVTGKNILNP